jgi:tRNA nucleotidyltransferase (CCA-adding enzyme)
MQIFTVGGAVRDELLGLPVKDRDYVVVGSTPEEMRARGFKAVGRDFPVFLHPQTQEEYALARTERKSGRGYHGFTFHTSPDVTLEEDLARRDLTINAIAEAADGSLVDPFHGQSDLAARILRHVGPSFVEDPVRVLRLARFAARFSDFSVAPETMALLRQMVASGEVDHLVPERVWQELAKGMLEQRPSRMFEILRQCGALAVLLPELDRLFATPQRADYHPEGDAGTHTLLVLDAAAAGGGDLAVRWAALLHDLGKGVTPQDILPRHHGHEEAGVKLGETVCDRFKVPNDCRELAVLAIRFHGQIHQIERPDGLRPGTIVKILGQVDAFRRPERFARLLEVCAADYDGRGGERQPSKATVHWQQALAAALTVDAGRIAATCADPKRIPEAVLQARSESVRNWLTKLHQ